MKTIIAVVGASGSGKTWLTRKLHDARVVKNIVSYTTRPVRDSETNGVEHWFVTEEDWQDAYSKKETLAYTDFGGYRYWTLPDQVDEDFTTYVIDEKGLVDLRARFSDRFRVVSVHVVRPDNPTDRDRMSRDSDRISLDDYDAELLNDGTESFYESGQKLVESLFLNKNSK